MPVDASIYGIGAERPKSMLDYQAEFDERESRKQTMQQNALALQGQRQKLDEYGRAIRSQESMRNRLQSLPPDANDDARANALYAEGTPEAIAMAEKLRKAADDSRRTKSSTLKDDVDSENKVVAAYRDMIGMVSDPQAAAQLVTVMHSDPRLKNTPMARVPLEQGLAQIGQDPQAFAQWKQQFGLGATKYIEQNKPQYITQNLGGTSQITALPGLGGPGTVASSSPITQSPDNKATVGATIRGQNLVNDRARDSNSTQRELLIQEKGLKVAELQDQANSRARAKEAGISAIGNQIGVIDKALDHPGRKTSTGLSGTLDPRNYVPGTDATDFRAVLDQIGGTAFLQAFESLKGGGAITEMEGKKATDAIARLNRAQSDGEFEVALNDLRQVMTDGYKRMSGKEFEGRRAAKPSDKPASDAFADAEKERRYQEWKRQQGAK